MKVKYVEDVLRCCRQSLKKGGKWQRLASGKFRGRVWPECAFCKAFQEEYQPECPLEGMRVCSYCQYPPSRSLFSDYMGGVGGGLQKKANTPAAVAAARKVRDAIAGVEKAFTACQAILAKVGK